MREPSVARHRTPYRITVVGAGTRFLSGISYYTLCLTNALAGSHRVSAVLMRQMLPTRLYPGRARVGAVRPRLEYDPSVHVFDGVDWYWFPSLFRALASLLRERPQFVVFQWWTGTVVHSYVILAVFARLLRCRVVIEFHEVLDTGELAMRPVRTYVRIAAPLLMRMTQGVVVHSDYDKAALKERYGLGAQTVALIPHGPYDHYASSERASPLATVAHDPASVVRVLYFGVIRPFKGVEDLLRAFEAMPPEEAERYRLTVVGETWEGWTVPADLIERSRYREHIDFVNRYVADEEVETFFAEADVVVLPYHRSSASGPLHLAMSHGLPVVVTSVGGLVEAVQDYEGAVRVPPRDAEALRRALPEAARLRGRRFADPHSWDRTVERYSDLFDALVGERA